VGWCFLDVYKPSRHGTTFTMKDASENTPSQPTLGPTAPSQPSVDPLGTPINQKKRPQVIQFGDGGLTACLNRWGEIVQINQVLGVA
jgi:hypothetical protein